MSEMSEMLSELRRVDGIDGVAVLTVEGMCAASDLDDRFDENAVAGLVSFLMSTTNRSLRDMTDGACTRITMHTTHGRLLISDCDGSHLVVITDQFADLESVGHEIDDAVRQLRRISRIRI